MAARSVTGLSAFFDAQRQDHLALVTQRVAAGAVVELHRRRPQHGHGFDIFRFGEVEARWYAGIAGGTPVGFPSRLQRKSDAAHQHRAAARARQQPDRGMAIALPRRRILGTRLDRQRRSKQGCDEGAQGNAEVGAQGNCDHHQTSLQAGPVPNH
jgi:hypothetical protein